MLEADFLDQARTMGLVNGHVMEGVQFDEMGRRVAYWLFSYHPGGVLILNPRGGIVSQPVPADQIMHVYRVLRPGQVRGVPWLAPVMMALRDLDDYCDAERVRKKVEACVTAFVQQPEGVDGDPLGIAGTDPSSGLPVESFQPGMVEYLKPGQEIKFNNPPAAGGYREYKMTELQGIMAGIGLPYELGTGDMSQVNYSSWRGGMLGFRNTVEAFRWLTLIPLFCDARVAAVHRHADPAGQDSENPPRTIRRSHLRSVQWTAPRFESVDPVKDAEAVLKDVRMGRKTWFEAVLENGYDPHDALQQIALFNKLVDKFEIILDSDPRNMTLRGQEQPAGTEERTPSSKAGAHQVQGPGFRGALGRGPGHGQGTPRRWHVARGQRFRIRDTALPRLKTQPQGRTFMKGNPQVIAGLQEAANIEGSMMLQYLLDQRDVKRLGLDLADGLKQMKEQCEDHMKCLVSRVLFLEGAPTIELKPAATHDSVTEILNDAFAAEQAAIARFTDLCKQCYDAGDMSNFHFYQHLVKWHREGDDKFKGHVAWLQKQLYQLKKLGENDYIAVSAVKD